MTGFPERGSDTEGALRHDCSRFVFMTSAIPPLAHRADPYITPNKDTSMTTPAPATTPNYAAAPAQAPLSVLSIVAFVLSIVGFNVVAIILGFIGLNQVKKNGQRGRGFAIAAIIIGFLSIALIIAVVVFSIAVGGVSGSVTYE